MIPRHAFRTLARNKGFVAVAVLCLALAIGLDTTVFSILDAVKHPTVPFRSPERLIQVSESGDPRGERITPVERRALLVQRMARFSEASATYRFHSWGPTEVRVGDTGASLEVVEVTPDFFPLLGVRMRLGRELRSAGDDASAVVTSGFWSRYFGNRRSLESARIVFDDRIYSVVGVLPPEFRPLFFDTDVFTTFQQFHPAAPAPWIDARRAPGQKIWRLAPGVTRAQVEADLDSLSQQLTERFGVVRTPFRHRVTSLLPNPQNFSQFHFAIGASALAVLLIACANLANLMLARGFARRRELALCLAIGASRAAVVRQLLAEGLILGVAGGVLGTMLSGWGIGLTGALWPHRSFLDFTTPHLTWRVVVFAVVATAGTIVLVGLLPAVRASDVDVSEPLKDGSGGATSSGRRYSTLAVVQVALALMLLMSTTVLTKSAMQVQATAFGYEPRGLFQANIPAGGPESNSGVRGKGVEQVLRSVQNVRGVLLAATLASARSDGGIALSDYEGDSLQRMVMPQYNLVSPTYPAVMGMTVVAGRSFEPGDGVAGGAVIVNEAAAHRLWPGQSPVGRLIKFGPPHSTAPWLHVVGVVRDMTYGAFDLIEAYAPPRAEAYVVPGGDVLRARSVVFRVTGDSARVGIAVAQAIRSAAGLTATPYVWPMFSSLSYYTSSLRFATGLFTFLSACGLGLAALGVYSVLAYSVSRRMREFAVRIALGASPGLVFGNVLRDGMVMALAGTGIGAFIAMGASRLLESLLYLVPPTDPVSLVLSESVLLVITLAACILPAHSATRADASSILRAT